MADAFRTNFAARAEVGACVCVYVDGRPVVDLWGGDADPETHRPWTRDTIAGVFSSTKGVTAIAVNRLVEEGRLDPDTTVASYWPEFAAAGKEMITVGQLMSHQAGLPYVEGDFTLDEVLAWEPMVAQLARQAPIWPPGSQHGYHMRTYGWLAGELIRRVTGLAPGEYIRREITAPLHVDFWIGLPEAEEARVAKLVPPKSDLRAALEQFGDSLLLAKVFSNPSGLFNYDDMWNARTMHAAELPSSSGIGNARALARLYASLVGDGVDGIRTLAPETLAAASVARVRGPDAVIIAPSAFGIGFMLGATFGAANPPTAVGHAGAGGSLSFCDPEPHVGFGYVMNDLRFDATGDPRSESLVRALYDILGA
jgi:CubicO group peptidase (beta-lactamase class C family)